MTERLSLSLTFTFFHFHFQFDSNGHNFKLLLLNTFKLCFKILIMLNTSKVISNFQIYSYIYVSLSCPTCQLENFRPQEGNIVHKTAGD